MNELNEPIGFSDDFQTINTILHHMQTRGDIFIDHDAHPPISQYTACFNPLQTLQKIRPSSLGLTKESRVTDLQIMHRLMNKLISTDHASDALRLHTIAVKRHFANAAAIYNSTIYYLGIQTYPMSEFILQLFYQALRLNRINISTFNITIDALTIKKIPKTEHIMGVFEEAKRLNHANTCTYNKTLRVLSKNPGPDQPLIMALFNEARAKHIADALTYQHAIQALSKSKLSNSSHIEALFYDAKRLKLTTLPILETVLYVVNKCNSPDVRFTEIIINEMKSLGLICMSVYCSAINPFSSKQCSALELDFITHLFNDAKNANGPKAGLYNHFIKVIAKSVTPDLTRIMDLFNEAKQLNMINLEFYNNVISAVINNTSPDTALIESLFNEALEFVRAQTDIKTDLNEHYFTLYQNTFYSMSQSNNAIDTNFIETLFKQVKTFSFFNSHFYYYAICAMTQSTAPNNTLIAELINEAYHLNIAYTFVYQNILNQRLPHQISPAEHDIITTSEVTPNVRELIHRMKTWGNIDGLNNQDDGIYKTQLKWITSLDDLVGFLSAMLDQSVYPSIFFINTFIKHLSKEQYLDDALECRTLALERNISNPSTHEYTLDAIANSPKPNPHLALAIFNETKKTGFLNVIIYKKCLDIMAQHATPEDHFDLEEAAYSLISEAEQTLQRNHLVHGNAIDFHELSYGEVYFGLMKRAHTELQISYRSEMSLNIIYNRCYSPASHTEQLKIAITRVMDKLSAQGIQSQFIEDTSNEAHLVMSCTRQPERCQSNALRQYSLFPESKEKDIVSLHLNMVLNPDMVLNPERTRRPPKINKHTRNHHLSTRNAPVNKSQSVYSSLSSYPPPLRANPINKTYEMNPNAPAFVPRCYP